MAVSARLPRQAGRFDNAAIFEDLGSGSAVDATMAFMATTLADRILNAIRYAPLDDDVLAQRLGVGHRQAVNQAALVWRPRAVSGGSPDLTGRSSMHCRRAQSIGLRNTPVRGRLTAALTVAGSPRMASRRLSAHLTAQGFDVAVAWGRVRGIDIDARHTDGRRYVIEAKAEVGSNGPQQVNYFLGMLGELVQRMDDAQAMYGIALPDNRQYRGLVDRLPALARERLRLSVFWVRRDGGELGVEVDCQPAGCCRCSDGSRRSASGLSAVVIALSPELRVSPGSRRGRGR